MILNEPPQHDRLDLYSNMPSRRRITITQPTSIPATSFTVRSIANGPQPDMQPAMTYSQFLGGLTFDIHTPILEEEPFQHSGNPPFPATSTLFGEAFTATSSYYPHQRNMAPGEYSNNGNGGTASGWIKDVFGQDTYVGHGRIEEVDDDAELAATPRARSPASSRFHPSQPASHASFGFHDESNFLISTPPPRPRPRKLPSLRAHSTASELLYHNSTINNWVPTLPPTQPASPLPDTPRMNSLGNRAPPVPVVPDDPNEVSLVTENLNLLESSQEAVRFLSTLFTSQSSDLDLSQHIDLCAQIEEHLESIRQSLNLRTKIGSEEWHVRSAAWNQKYFKRLNSVKTTLQRLMRMTKLIDNNQSLGPRQRQSVLTKLDQHEAKLGDLASKYTAAFDRLRLRHLHFLLNQSHSEAKCAQKTRLASRQSFENYWQREKTLRLGLRREFHDLRQELHGNNAHRVDRQNSAH